MDHSCDKTIIKPPSKALKNGRSLGKSLYEEEVTSSKCAPSSKRETRDEGGVQQMDTNSEIDAPKLISRQDDGSESSIKEQSDPPERSFASEPLQAVFMTKVDDQSVSLLLTGADQSDSTCGDANSFLKGRIENEQHRLEIQQRAKRLLRGVNEKEPRSNKWQGSLLDEDEHDEEATLLNTDQANKIWDGNEGCDILDDPADIIRAEQTAIPPPPRRSREIEDSPRPRSCEAGSTGEDSADQAGGLAVLKETVAASLSMFRRDLLPLKLQMVNSGDDSPRRGGAVQSGRREDAQPAAAWSESAERSAALSEPPGGKTGFALLRNSLAILKEDLGLGSRM